MSARRLFIALMLVLPIIAVAASTAMAQTVTVYNSIPTPLPGNASSVGPEAYGFAELGDGLNLYGTGGTLGRVTVILSSWACTSGNWFSGTCVTTHDATFDQPITVNIYGVTYVGDVATPSGLLATITKTFDIPYRPTSTPALCGGDATEWYDSKGKTCYGGLAVPVDVDFSSFQIPIPANDRIIVTVAYNTTSYGPTPIGTTACNSTSAGCPYDALNISVDGNGPTGLANGVGAFLDWNGIFANLTTSELSCTVNATLGQLALDTSLNTPCWAGLHPQIEVMANHEYEHE